MVVGCAHFIAFLVRQLQFNVGMVKPHFMQQGGGHPSESVPRHAALVAHAVQSTQGNL